MDLGISALGYDSVADIVSQFVTNGLISNALYTIVGTGIAGFVVYTAINSLRK